MQIRGTTRLIGLLGDPVGHSLSPAMHNAAIAHAGLDAIYVALPVKPDNLKAALDGLRAVNFVGANVTLPHKSAVIPLLDEVSPLSRMLGAVNTIVHRDDGTLYGETTDGLGFIHAFEDEGHSFAGKSVAILGNGGSARTIAFTLALRGKVERLALITRLAAKGSALAEEVRAAVPGSDVVSLSREDYANVRGNYEVVVNTTPVGMTPNIEDTPIPADLLDARQIVYDIVYNPQETRLLREAKARGCATVGGLGMLIHQGRLSFGLWTGHDLPAAVFHEGILRQLQPEAGSPS